jgi:hypothetical protein
VSQTPFFQKEKGRIGMKEDIITLINLLQKILTSISYNFLPFLLYSKKNNQWRKLRELIQRT